MGGLSVTLKKKRKRRSGRAFIQWWEITKRDGLTRVDTEISGRILKNKKFGGRTDCL